MMDPNLEIYQDLQKVLLYISQYENVTKEKISKHFNRLRNNPTVGFERQFKSIVDYPKWATDIVNYLIHKRLVREVKHDRAISNRNGDSYSTKHKKWKELKITIDGIIFLNKGGFLQQYNLDKNAFARSLKMGNYELSKNLIIAGICHYNYSPVIYSIHLHCE